MTAPVNPFFASVFSNRQAQFPELLQGFGITAGIVHGIVRVFCDAILFPFRSLGHVFDQAGIKIADPTSGKTEWVSTEKAVEVVIDELPVERDVVRHKDRPA